MTAIQIARQLNTRLIRNGKGFQCSCPVKLRHEHGDRNRSLSIREVGDWVRFKCFTGCEREEILSALGLTVRDLSLKELTRNPEWEQKRKDSDRLKLLIRRHGLAIMAQQVIPRERNYWAAVERNIAIEGRELRRKLYPDEAARIRRNQVAQHLIREYGFDELWECVP